MNAAACSSASGNPPSHSASSSAADRSRSPLRLTKKSAAVPGCSAGTSIACPGGQCWLWEVISTRPGPAGGTNRSTAAQSCALSNITSQSVSARASAACTAATGSRASATSSAPSWAAKTAKSAPSTAGSSAWNCQHTATSARWRCAYSTATLVLPAPPSPHSTATLGPGCSGSAASRAFSSARSASRPARTVGRDPNRTGRPGVSGRRWYARVPIAVPPLTAATAPAANFHVSGAATAEPDPAV